MMVVYHIIKHRFNHSTHCTAAQEPASPQAGQYNTHRSAYHIPTAAAVDPNTLTHPTTERSGSEQREHNIYAETPVSHNIFGVPIPNNSMP